VTFTNKAANEMRERVKDMVRDGLGKKVVRGHLPRLLRPLLREFAEHVGYKKNFVIYSQRSRKPHEAVLKTCSAPTSRWTLDA
jgi:DNA helicase-2/ATP-dependent DNA helicase PcrA